MAKTFQELSEESRDAGYQSRVQTALVATSLSIAQNGASTGERKELARNALNSSASYANAWALPVRVSGANIAKDTLVDSDITSGVETLFAVFAGV